MPKISVIIPTIRGEEAIALNRTCLKRQTFTDFEVIIQEAERPIPTGLRWTFNRDMNKALRRSTGELIVSYQDNIWMPPDGLEKFWYWYTNKGACISGVGNIYKRLDELGKPIEQVWTDPRIRTDQGSMYECYPQDWELNYACAPRRAFYDIGGFDESMDVFYGMDNVDVARRMDKLEYKFYLDQTNECRGIYHDRKEDWDTYHWMNHGFSERNIPTHLDYIN